MDAPPLEPYRCRSKACRHLKLWHLTSRGNSTRKARKDRWKANRERKRTERDR